MKKSIITIFTVFFICCSTVNAKINLFAYSRPAPEIDFYYQDGKKSNFEDYKGKFLIVLFWSKTCLPCIRELKNLDNFYLKTKDSDIKIIMISPSSDWQNNLEQMQFLKKYKAEHLDFYTDKNGNLSANFGIFSYPHSVLIDKEGEEIGRIRGQINWDSKKTIQKIYDIKDKKITGPYEE